MARKIAIANNKGGTGKTTTAMNLGVGLNQLGKKVLLIDLDPQAALSSSFGIPVFQLSKTTYNVLISSDELSLKDIIHNTDSGPHIAPSNIDLSAAELELMSELGRERILADVLEKFPDKYDFILIDCPPFTGTSHHKRSGCRR